MKRITGGMMIFATILALAASDFESAGGHQKSKPTPKDSLKDLGTYGETFPVTEQSLLEVIKAKLQKLAQSGKLQNHQETIARRAKEQMNRPSAVPGLRKTTIPRSFEYDPSLTVPYDLKDHKGRVFHRQGTTVNPLDTHSFQHPFLFVDGDDADQVAWAIAEFKAAEASRKPKIILVQGAPMELSKKVQLPVCFDQSGILVKKLGITQVPARVSQNKAAKVLTVEELEMHNRYHPQKD